MFCIKCGKPAKIGNFCEKCYLHGKELFSLKNVQMRYCDNCDSFYTQREKVSRAALEDFIARQIETKNDIRKVSARVTAEHGKVHGAVKAEGFIRPVKILVTEEKEMTVYPRKMKCEDCVKLLGGYHEAVIQVRGPAQDKIVKKLSTLLGKDTVAVRSSKDGYDILVVHKAPAASAVQAVRKKCEVNQSFKLVGEKKGRKLYRNFYAVR